MLISVTAWRDSISASQAGKVVGSVDMVEFLGIRQAEKQNAADGNSAALVMHQARLAWDFRR
jgi:hypothetical protein